MRRWIALLGCFALVLTPAAAHAKKKQKPTKLGTVLTASGTGPVATGTGSISTAVATCPSGTIAFGGGFSLTQGSPLTTAVFESYRSSPTTWTASSINSNPSASGAVSTLAYCRRSSRPILEVSGPTGVPGGLGQSGAITVFCPPRTFAVSGGFQSTATPGTKNVALIQSSLGVSNAWVIQALNNGSPPQTLTDHLYCLKGILPPLLVRAETSATLAQGQSATATTPKCPKAKKKTPRKKRRKRVLSAGGFKTFSLPSQASLFTNTSITGNGWTSTAVNVSSSPAQVSVMSLGICV
jgi:hypothetical protein